LRFFAELHAMPNEAWKPRTHEVLEFVGLAEFADRMADQLSGGMKQKLGLATALVHRPRVLLLDEPTGGVDPVTRQDFWQLIIRIVSQEGVAVLISTPYMDEAARCTRVGFVHRGRKIVEDSPGQVAARLNGRILELMGEPRGWWRVVNPATWKMCRWRSAALSVRASTADRCCAAADVAD
jgi:ABC-2 type transport system ATP-binding protein